MESQIQNLLDWAVLNGSFIDPTLKFQYSEDRGVYAMSSSDQTIPPSTPQLKIPLDLIIRNELADEYFNSHNFDSLHNPNALLKLLLAKLKYDNEPTIIKNKDITKFFKPYVDLLPVGRQTNSPFYYNSDEVSLLTNTNLGGSLNLKLKSILNEWKSTIEQLSILNQEIIEKELEFYNKFDSLEWDDIVNSLLKTTSWTNFGAYLWSSIIFTSRAFPHHIIDSTSKDGQAILLPLIDLLNHDNSTKAYWKFETMETGEQYFTLQNNDILSSGQEVFNNYGAKGNEELLMGYGFTIKDNKNDTVTLRVKLPIETIKQAEKFGVKIPKLDDYTHHAFLSDLSKEKNQNEDDKYENLDDGLLFFLNKSNPLPPNLLLLFSFLVSGNVKDGRTLRSDLSALQNLRMALEKKQELLKQDIFSINEDNIDPFVKATIGNYKKGQKDIYKLSLSTIKSNEKMLLQDYKTHFLNLKKILKRDDRLFQVLEKLGLDSYEKIEQQDYCDVVLFVWLVSNIEIPTDDYIIPSYLSNEFRELQNDSNIATGEFSQLVLILKGLLAQTDFKNIISERNISVASEVIRKNSYVRVSTGEIILVEPVQFK